MFILNHAINSLSVKDNRKLKTGGKKVTFQNVNFLNHWLQNTRSCGKKKFFPENTIFKGIFFWYFQTATCYKSSLVRSRLDPALVKAAYNIACPQLNGDTLIFLYAVLWMLERVWTLATVFSSCQGHAAQDISFPLKQQISWKVKF